MSKRTLTNIEAINKLNLLGLKYDFSKFEYNGDRLNKSIVICPVHGKFKSNYLNVLKSIHHKGLICRKCRNEYQQKIMLEKFHGKDYVPEIKEKHLKKHKLKKIRIKHYKAKFMCYWTKKRCAKVALKFITRSDFWYGAKGAYKKASKYKWLDEICQHMIRQGDRKHKCIYSYEFPDNHAYIGLTYNINERQNHRNKDKNDQVTKYICNTGLIPLRKQLTEYLPVEQAIILEGEYINKYRNDGWILLNKQKAGGIGGHELKWTKEKCREVALKCQTKTEFVENFSGAYSSASCNKWLDEICSHMMIFSKPRSHWTLEKCIEDIKKYVTKNEWRKNSPTAYRFACKHNCLKECYQYMRKVDKKT